MPCTCDACQAEIASLRAELATTNELYAIAQSDLAAVSLQYDAATAVIERLEAEIASLRAELAATKKKCREADERAFKRTNDTNNLREEIKDRDEYVLSLHEQLDALRDAAARQDAEEKARLTAENVRLRAEMAIYDTSVAWHQTKYWEHTKEIARLKEALDGARKDLAPIHICDVISRDCAICKTVLRIDAALASLPRGESKGEDHE